MVHELDCVAGEHCRGFSAGEPEQRNRAPLCESCLAVAQRDIAALSYDHRDLQALLAPSLSVWGDGTPHGTDGHAPLRLGVEALQRQIVAVLVTWEQAVRERHHLADVTYRGVRDGFAVVRAVSVLVPRVELLAMVGETMVLDYPVIDTSKDGLAAWEARATMFRGGTYATLTGAQGVLDLMVTHRRARSVLGLTAPVRRLPGNCDRCGGELRQDQPREAGDEQPVYCGSCAVSMTYEDYRKRTGLVAA